MDFQIINRKLSLSTYLFFTRLGISYYYIFYWIFNGNISARGESCLKRLKTSLNV